MPIIWTMKIEADVSAIWQDLVSTDPINQSGDLKHAAQFIDDATCNRIVRQRVSEGRWRRMSFREYEWNVDRMSRSKMFITVHWLRHSHISLFFKKCSSIQVRRCVFLRIKHLWIKWENVFIGVRTAPTNAEPVGSVGREYFRRVGMFWHLSNLMISVSCEQAGENKFHFFFQGVGAVI
jgi:hypothetical protein